MQTLVESREEKIATGETSSASLPFTFLSILFYVDKTLNKKCEVDKKQGKTRNMKCHLWKNRNMKLRLKKSYLCAEQSVWQKRIIDKKIRKKLEI